MNRSIDEKSKTSQGKLFVLTGFILLFCCAFLVILFIAFKQYESSEKEYIEQQQALLANDLGERIFRINLWKDSIATSVNRISSSELYRLFSEEMMNNSELIELVKEDVDITVFPLTTNERLLLEQAPLLRNLLIDFTQQNGFLSATLVSKDGTTLLDTHEDADFPEEFFPVLETALNTKTFQVSPVYVCEENLCVDFIDPLLPFLGTSEEANTALALKSNVYADALVKLSGENSLLDASFTLLENNNDQWHILGTEYIPLDSAISQSFVLDELANVPFALRQDLKNQSSVYSQIVHIPGIGWWLAGEIPSEQIQVGLKSIQNQTILSVALATLALLLFLPIVWWFTSGKAEHLNALKFKELYVTIQTQKQFLDSVNLSLGVGLFMFDEKENIQFFNSSFEEILETEAEKIAHASIYTFFSEKNNFLLKEAIRKVLDTHSSVTVELTHLHKNAAALYRTTLFPFIQDKATESLGIVGTMQDITEYRNRQNKLDALRSQTLNAFLNAIESVDPYLTGHSKLLQHFSLLIGKVLNLPEGDIQTISTSAELSQIGKLFVPPQILQKTEKLSAKEQAIVRQIPEKAFNLLKDMNFDCPIAETIYSMYENMDGSGYPRGLTDKDLTMPMRILSLINVFCALISPRSYREKRTLKNTFEILENNPAYDQVLVQALKDTLRTEAGKNSLKDHIRISQSIKHNEGCVKF